MANNPQINDMGSEVVEGYACKPKNFDPNRPAMHYKTILSVCGDARCAQKSGADRAAHLRALVKQMGLNTGERRVKIVRTHCYGMCRFGHVVQIGENTQANGTPHNNGLWLRHAHQYSDAEWMEILEYLASSQSIRRLLGSGALIPMDIYT